jgi:hypothetical protein
MIALISIYFKIWYSTHDLYKTLNIHAIPYLNVSKACRNNVNHGKMKHFTIEKYDKKGMPQRLCLGISLPLVYRANITLEKDQTYS